MSEREGVDALEDGFNVSISGLDESGVVDINEESNEELAVHAIGDTTMSRDELVKVLLLESALHGGSEETTEGRNDGREESGDHHVQLDGLDSQITNDGGEEREARGRGGDKLRDGLRRKERSNGASMGRGSQLRGRATEPIELSKETSRDEGDNDGDDSGTKETFPGLIGRQLGQRTVNKLASKGHADKVGHNIVTDDHGVGQHEPEEAVINVDRNNARLNDNAQEGHQHPGQLTELVLDSVLAKRRDEQQETTNVEDE